MRPVITVTAIGPGDPALMTLQAAESLRSAGRLVLRTAVHPVAGWLEEQGIPFSSLDEFYGRYEDFDAMHKAMAEELWRQARSAPLTFAVPEPASDGAVAALGEKRPGDGRLTVLPGLTGADLSLAALPSPAGWRVMPAAAVESLLPDTAVPLLVTELDSAMLAGEVKLRLSGLYDEEMEILFFPSTVKTAGRMKRIRLWELDRQTHYDHTVRAAIPPAPLQTRQRFDLRDLMDIMERLRSPEGCPWDGAQTHRSLRRYLIEEAYEAAGAIDEADDAHLADELGDVLLQVVFHASIGRSQGSFDMGDVTTAICRKMIHRHPHVFRGEQEGEPERSWEELKQDEKGLHSASEALQDVSRALPALMRAAKVQKKAAQTGFVWGSALEALRKVEEETAEVRQELQAGRDPAGELGDLLLAGSEVARLAGVEPEAALEAATEKFIRRFGRMVELARERGLRLEGLSLEELLALWQAAKAGETGP